MKIKLKHLPAWMMVTGLLLLLVLQGLWLNAEYRSAAEAFQKETNLIFRTTLFDASNSLFRAHFNLPALYDSIQQEPQEPVRDSINIQGRVSRVALIRTGGDVPSREEIFQWIREAYDADALGLLFSRALHAHGIDVSFDILEKAIDLEPGGYRPEQNESLTSPYIMTSYVPLGGFAYAARFNNASFMLLRQMLPQIIFSLLTTLAILVSFLLISKNLRTQQQLLAEKEDFIGNMTHELKTPLATVGVALEALRGFDVLKHPQKTREYLDMAATELQRLGLITDKIFNVASLDREAEPHGQTEWIDTKALAGQVLSSFRLLAEHKKLKLVFQTKGDTRYFGNQDHLTQLIFNLVDNAVKYGGEGPEVILQLEGHPDMLLISVSDHGPGIPSHLQSKVFEKFYRLPSGYVHNVKGHGLGLYYVQKVVSSYDGSIRIHSKPGEGSTFTVKLPRHG
jgi:two-component system, OmpR family, phosphate regulon sensor histidine kinase PhoR